jgi:hypothetical protein
MANENTNCLQGIACPKCGCGEGFKIAATAVFTVTDDGTECDGDVEWQDDDFIQCGACYHGGEVADFTAREGA